MQPSEWGSIYGMRAADEYRSLQPAPEVLPKPNANKLNVLLMLYLLMQYPVLVFQTILSNTTKGKLESGPKLSRRQQRANQKLLSEPATPVEWETVTQELDILKNRLRYQFVSHDETITHTMAFRTTEVAQIMAELEGQVFELLLNQDFAAAIERVEQWQGQALQEIRAMREQESYYSYLYTVRSVPLLWDLELSLVTTSKLLAEVYAKAKRHIEPSEKASAVLQKFKLKVLLNRLTLDKELQLVTSKPWNIWGSDLNKVLEKLHLEDWQIEFGDTIDTKLHPPSLN